MPKKSQLLVVANGSLERSSDLSNSGDFKRQTAWDNAVYNNSFLRYYSDTQSVSPWFYKETEIKIWPK